MELKYYKLEQRDNINIKQKRTVYKLRPNGRLSGQDFINMVAHQHGFTPTVIEGVLKDVARELALMLGEGRNVTVPGIGAFSLGIRLEEKRREKLEDEPDTGEPNARHIKLHHVNFRIDKHLFKAVDEEFRHRKLKRIYGKQGVRITIDDMKQSERLDAAKAFLAENHFMHVGDYAAITGLSYSSAQRELRELDKYEFSGIKAKGSGSHRVYVLQSREE